MPTWNSSLNNPCDENLNTKRENKMKISSKVLANFNAGKSCGNENYCKAYHIPSHEQTIWLNKCKSHYFGCMSGRLTMKDVREYREIVSIAGH